MTPYRWQQLTPVKKTEQWQKLPHTAVESAQLIVLQTKANVLLFGIMMWEVVQARTAFFLCCVEFLGCVKDVAPNEAFSFWKIKSQFRRWRRRRGSAFCRVYLAEMELIQDLAPSAVLSSCFLWDFHVKQAVKQLFFFVCCYLRVASVGLPTSLLHPSCCSPLKPLDIRLTTPHCSTSFTFSSVHFRLLSHLFRSCLLHVERKNSQVFESNMLLIHRWVNTVCIHVQQLPYGRGINSNVEVIAGELSANSGINREWRHAV